MSLGLSFYAIKKEGLKDAPKAIKDFVKDFFEEEDVFGIHCYVAIDCDDKSPWGDMDDEDYAEGLSKEELEGCGVFDWFTNHPEIVFHYYWS